MVKEAVYQPQEKEYLQAEPADLTLGPMGAGLGFRV